MSCILLILQCALPGIIFVPEIQSFFFKTLNFIITFQYKKFLWESLESICYFVLFILASIFIFCYELWTEPSRTIIRTLPYLPDTFRFINYTYAIINWLTTSEVDVACSMVSNNNAEIVPIDQNVEQHAQRAIKNCKIGVIDLKGFCKENCPECDIEPLYKNDRGKITHTPTWKILNEVEAEIVVSDENFQNSKNPSTTTMSMSSFQDLKLIAYKHPVIIDSTQQGSSSYVLCYTMTKGSQPIVSFNESSTVDVYMTLPNLITTLKTIDDPQGLLKEIEKVAPELYQEIIELEPGLNNITSPSHNVSEKYQPCNLTIYEGLPKLSVFESKGFKGFESNFRTSKIDNSSFFDHIANKAYYPFGKNFVRSDELQLASLNSTYFPKSMIDFPVSSYTDSFHKNLTADTFTKQCFYNYKNTVEMFNSTTIRAPNYYSAESLVTNVIKPLANFLKNIK